MALSFTAFSQSIFIQQGTFMQNAFLKNSYKPIGKRQTSQHKSVGKSLKQTFHKEEIQVDRKTCLVLLAIKEV